MKTSSSVYNKLIEKWCVLQIVTYVIKLLSDLDNINIFIQKALIATQLLSK